MTESLDEGMRGTGERTDYDDWADETPERLEPEPPDRLTELAVGLAELAELAGLTIGPPLPAEHAKSSVTVKLTCGRCNGVAFLIDLRLDPGVTNELFDTHLCTGIRDAERTGEPALFPFTLAVRNTT
jgi:hypothetical protein